jgi:hypothetical protein
MPTIKQKQMNFRHNVLSNNVCSASTAAVFLQFHLWFLLSQYSGWRAGGWEVGGDKAQSMMSL